MEPLSSSPESRFDPDEPVDSLNSDGVGRRLSVGERTLATVGAIITLGTPTAFVFIHSTTGSGLFNIFASAVVLGTLLIVILFGGGWAPQPEALNSVRDTSPSVSRRSLDTETRSILDDIEFRPYGSYVEQVLAHVSDDKARISADLSKARRKAQDATNATVLHRDHVRRRRIVLLATFNPVAATACTIFLASTNTIVGKLIFPRFLGIPFPNTSAYTIVAGLTALLLAATSFLLARQVIEPWRVAAWEEKQAYRQFQQAFRSAVGESIRRSLNKLLGARGILALASAAPRLVELNTSQITPSRYSNYIRDFITSHDASAVGLAGFRGSGKSTIMRSLVADQTFATRAVFVPAPVAYESGDFARHLLQCVALTLIGRQHIRRIQPNTASTSRLATFLVASIIGVVLILFETTGSALPAVGPVGIAGTVLFTYSIIGLCYSFVLRFAGYTTFSGPATSLTRSAERILNELRWESEYGSTSKNIAKFTTLLELNDESSVKRKERALSRIDYISRLRELLQECATQPGIDRFIICVDELDKLPTTALLIDAVNNLKDLFHTQGVHFVVSVSLDALRSFEQRGLPTRDAFDSSFDTVLEIGHLSIAESVDVIASRATQFPKELSYYCHAWSGGLPRDLLRVARRCVEIHSAEPISTSELIEKIVTADLLALFDGLLSSISSKETEVLIWKLRSDLLGTDRMSGPPPVEYRYIAESETLPIIKSAMTKFWVGKIVIELARRRIEIAYGNRPKTLCSWFEKLATASGSTALHPRLQEEALSSCVEILDETGELVESNDIPTNAHQV